MMGVIKESSTEEAWELVGQDDKVIKSVVKQAGYNNDEESVERLTPIIDSLPTEDVDYTQIKTFYNLENKFGDKGLLSKMYQISKTDDPRKEYGEYMDKRDSGENRNRGYKPVKNYDRIVNNEYESPVVLKYNKKYYYNIEKIISKKSNKHNICFVNLKENDYNCLCFNYNSIIYKEEFLKLLDNIETIKIEPLIDLEELSYMIYQKILY